MSGNDLLERATRELRDAGAAPAAEVAMTRARLMETLKKGERRRTRIVFVLLPIAAVLVGSTALARSGTGLRGVWEQVVMRVGLAPTSPAAPSNAANVPPPPLPEPQPLPESPPEVLPPLDPTPSPWAADSPVQASQPPAIATRARPKAALLVPTAAPASAPALAVAPAAKDSAQGAPAAGAPVNDEAKALSLYKEAYQRHFVEQNYAAALAAWDEYLRAAPGGRLTVEARYNRAIALVRLGRKDEARAALAPFARGEIGGGYRSREARALLAALGDGAP